MQWYIYLYRDRTHTKLLPTFEFNHGKRRTWWKWNQMNEWMERRKRAKCLLRFVRTSSLCRCTAIDCTTRPYSRFHKRNRIQIIVDDLHNEAMIKWETSRFLRVHTIYLWLPAANETKAFGWILVSNNVNSWGINSDIQTITNQVLGSSMAWVHMHTALRYDFTNERNVAREQGECDRFTWSSHRIHIKLKCEKKFMQITVGMIFCCCFVLLHHFD